MAAKTITMEQLKLILRLRQNGISVKEIARQTGLARNTVKKYLSNVALENQVKMKPEKLADLAFNTDTANLKSDKLNKLLDHFMYAETQIKLTGVTRQLLWLEYKEIEPEGYNYSQYCYHFSDYLSRKEVVMHLEHTCGAETMIDFAGKKLGYLDVHSRELIACNVFISVLPCSGLIFCKAVHTQNTYDFIDCINEMLTFYGGTTQTIICDNLKTAVTRPSKYEPVFTEMCHQLEEHYQNYFSATRPYKPRDKAMVEKCVNIVYNNIYGPLRKQTFYSLNELNNAIAINLKKLNDKPYKGSAYSRMDLFEQQEKHTLIALPTQTFNPKKVITVSVQRNYHVQLKEDHHYYSVPYTFAGKRVKVLYDNKTVEIYLDHARIAVHTRNAYARTYHTILEHMPSNHQNAVIIKGWTKDDLLNMAARIGVNTRKAAEHIISSSFYPEQNFKSCYGMIMLKNSYPHHRIEAACARALSGTRINYTMIRNILIKGLDKQALLFETTPLPDHDNIRGPEDYK